MPKQERIPTALATLVGELLGSHYFNHRAIDLLFQEAGAPEEVPDGSCAQKSTTWLKRASADPKVEVNCRHLGGLKESRQEQCKGGKSGSKFSGEVKITYFCHK